MTDHLLTSDAPVNAGHTTFAAKDAPKDGPLSPSGVPAGASDPHLAVERGDAAPGTERAFTPAPQQIVRWRAVAGFPGYEVSDQGQIRSWKQRASTPLVLRQLPNDAGYLTVVLYRRGQRVGGRRVHVLVAQAFLGERPADAVIRHLDGEQTNNRLSNLCYGTASENATDQVLHGVHAQAAKTHCAQGHAYDAVNTQWLGRGGRRCRACARAAKQAARLARTSR